MRRILAVAATVLAALLAAAPASAATFTNEGAAVAIPGDSAIPVSGLEGPITDVNVTLNGVAHTRPDDIDIILVSPSDTRVMLMSDACGDGDIAGRDFTFDDDAAGPLSDNGECPTGTYDPTDYEPASGSEPGGVEYLQLNGFNGEVANGTWRIQTDDDTAGETGDIANGWSITITSAGTPPITISSGNQAFGPATPFPAELDAVVDDPAVITDLDITLHGLTHQDPKHIDMFVEGPGGQKAWIMSDVCPGLPMKLAEIRADEEAPNPFNSAEGCGSGTFAPFNFDEGLGDSDTFPAPAPASPGAETLSTFDLTDPNGTWKLWIQDDSEGRAGFINGFWGLEMTTRPAASVNFAVGAQTVREGDTLILDVVRSADGATMGRGSIVVATQSGTAQAGSDFVPVSETVTFEPGQTTKTVSIPVIADGDGEATQDFSVALGQREGDARAGTPAALGVTILADPNAPRDDIPTGNEDKPAPQPFTPANTIRSATTTRRCHRRGARIQFSPQMPAGVAILRSEVYVNGRKIEDNIGVSAVAPIRLTMTGRRMRVRIKLTSHDGRVVTIRRTFRRCSARREKR
ncbi:MAG TPA: Calx-beta domain-containing protein [Solirubrobacteraceae bacterium]